MITADEKTFERGHGRANMRMIHARDPRQEIFERLGPVLGNIEVFHNQILVAIYVRPEKTAGGILLPDSQQKEDVYQGKVGLVLKKGPLAFVNDARNDFAGQDVEVGDWIAYRAADGWLLNLSGASGKEAVRMLEDTHVKLRLTSPDDIW